MVRGGGLNNCRASRLALENRFTIKVQYTSNLENLKRKSAQDTRMHFSGLPKSKVVMINIEYCTVRTLSVHKRRVGMQ